MANQIILVLFLARLFKTSFFYFNFYYKIATNIFRNNFIANTKPPLFISGGGIYYSY